METNYSIWIPRSSSREGHVTALIANAKLRDHSNYMLSGIESLWFHQMTDRKEITFQEIPWIWYFTDI